MEALRSNFTFESTRKIMKKILFALFIAGMVIGCSSHTTHDAKLKTDTDSVAYIIGLNIGTNLLRMDSTLNIEAVCRGIREVAQGNPSMSLEEAETYFLGYMNYTLPEKAMALEEQWLADLAESSRDYARTRTGITYHIQVLGDQERLRPGRYAETAPRRPETGSAGEREAHRRRRQDDCLDPFEAGLRRGWQRGDEYQRQHHARLRDRALQARQICRVEPSLDEKRFEIEKYRYFTIFAPETRLKTQ